MADEIEATVPETETPALVRVVFEGPGKVRCAGRVWEAKQPQNVNAECAEIALTHPSFRKLRLPKKRGS